MKLAKLALVVAIYALSGCLSPQEARETGADQAPMDQAPMEQAPIEQAPMERVEEQPAPVQQGESQVVRYETDGNLESLNDIGCIPLSEAKNSYTPPDLYRGSVACIVEGNAESAVALFMLAGVYGRFDMGRVADASAHQAPGMLVMNAFQPLPDETKEPFSNELERVMNNPQSLAAMCDAVRAVGPPDYHPRYMIQHGLKAVSFYASGEDLVEDFDPAATWQTLMSSYLRCPGA